MIKTIATLPNWSGLPDGVNLWTQISNWRSTGYYTGQKVENIDTVTNAMIIERWDWADEEAANAYKTLAISTLGSYYPGMQVDIVVE